MRLECRRFLIGSDSNVLSSKKNADGVVIQYSGGNFQQTVEYNTELRMICAENAGVGAPRYISKNATSDPEHWTLEWATQYACTSGSGSGALSGGSILLIM